MKREPMLVEYPLPSAPIPIQVSVVLPAQSSRNKFFRLIKLILTVDMKPRYSAVELDFSAVELLGIRAIAVLSNLIELLQNNGVRVTFIRFQNCKAAPFLKRSGFYARYLSPGGAPEPTCRVMLPLTLVDYRGSLSYIENRLTPWLEAALDMQEGQAASIEVCFKEIFNNIVDHSTEDVGCSIAAFDPVKGIVEICASDFGVGIPYNVRKKIDGIDDAAAIEKACEKFFTTQSTPQNRGIGLTTLLQNVVDLNAGQVLLFSGNGFLTYSAMIEDKPIETGLTAVGYPGTLVHIKLDVKTVNRTVIEEVFAW